MRQIDEGTLIFEIELKRFAQRRECVLDGRALACHFDFKRPGDVQIIFAVHGGGQSPGYIDTVARNQRRCRPR